MQEVTSEVKDEIKEKVTSLFMNGKKMREFEMDKYKSYTIEFRPKPIPIRSSDWDFVHEDYDGPGDPRCGCAESAEACKLMIDELEEDESI